MLGDWHAAHAGDRRVLRAWVIHIPACAFVVVLLAQAKFPIWAYLIAAYSGLSLLKICSYAEHRAHQDVGARTAVVEDYGLLAFLFLNNNFHAVHHIHPQIAWYTLPTLYRAQKGRFCVAIMAMSIKTMVSCSGTTFLPQRSGTASTLASG